MLLIDAWKHVVLNNYVNFEGRANRAEFWWYVLANLIIYLVLFVLMSASSIFSLVYVIFALGTLLPSIAVAIRRLHDTNKSGWLLLLSLVPLVGGIILIVFYATKGDTETNGFGPPHHWPSPSTT